MTTIYQGTFVPKSTLGTRLHVSVIYCTKSKVNSNGVCNYYDFIRREDVKDYRLLYGSISLSPHSEKIYDHLMFLVLKLVWIRTEYSLV